MMKLKSLLIVSLSSAFFCAAAFAQGVGQLGPGQVWGNFGSVQAPAAPTTLMTFPVNNSNLACFNGTAGVLKDCGINISGGGLTINPTPNSFTQGINISQSSPIGGSFAGPISFDTINIVDQGFTVTGSGNDPYSLSNSQAIGFRVNYSTTGGGLRGGGIVALRVTGPTAGSYYGFGGVAYTNVSNSALLWGNIGIAKVGPSGSVTSIIGMEGEVGVATGGVANYRFAVGANTQGPVAGAVMDGAYVVSAGGDGPGAAPFKKMFVISSLLYGQTPLATTADIFWSDSAITIATVFNASNWTLTGNFADFQKFGINGANGKASFGIPISSINATYQLQVSAASSGSVGIGVSPIGSTTSGTFVEVLNSTVSSDVILLANESTRTTSRYGVVLGNYAELSAFAGNGLIVGTAFSAPLFFGTNNLNRMQIASGGTVNIGPNVSSTASLTVNANTVSPASGGGTVFHMNGADAVGAQAVLDNYGTVPGGLFAFRSARGTGASFTASQNGDTFGTFGFVGASAANVFANTSGGNGGALIGANATENWSATNQGTRLKFFTTDNGTAAVALRLVIQSTGGLNLGATQATLAGSEFGLNKISASGSAPGAGTAKLAVVAGTSGGTCKLIMYAGTSTTPTTVLDNVGAGC